MKIQITNIQLGYWTSILTEEYYEISTYFHRSRAYDIYLSVFFNLFLDVDLSHATIINAYKKNITFLNKTDIKTFKEISTNLTFKINK